MHWEPKPQRWPGQIRTADRITDGGDSGGPWYINNTALGVHSNAQYVAFQYSQFQPISDATRKTGTLLLTSLNFVVFRASGPPTLAFTRGLVSFSSGNPPHLTSRGSDDMAFTGVRNFSRAQRLPQTFAHLVLLMMATTACGASPSPAATSSKTAPSEQSLPTESATGDSDKGSRLELASGADAIIAPRGDGSSLEAQPSGTIVDVDGECLGLSDGSFTSVLVFEYGTKVSSDGTGVVTPEGVSLKVGDRIRGSGGGFAWDPSQVQPADSMLPPACYALGASSTITRVEVRPAG